MIPRSFSNLCLAGLFLMGLVANAFATSTPRQHAAIASLQIIHNAPDAGLLDVYADDTRLLDDFDFRTATPFEVILAGTYTFDVVAGADADNSNPIFSTTLTLVSSRAYVMVALGLVQPEAGEPAFDLAVLENALTTSSTENVEVAVVHGAPDLGELDVRLLDPVDNNTASRLLANNIVFGDIVFYQRLTPSGFNVEVSSFDNTAQYDVFRLEVQRFRSQSLVLLLSGRGTSHTEDLEVLFVAADGMVAMTPVITASEEEKPPVAFALRGNHPNPFHLSTSVWIDLPAAAAVRVDLYDLRGRRVLTTPAHALAAGTDRAVPVETAPLASGVYLYRVLAQTASATYTSAGRMVLVQ